MDKSYYDYDYSKPDGKWSVRKNAPKNDEELKALLNHLGIEERQPESNAERLQMEVMKEEKLKQENS